MNKIDGCFPFMEITIIVITILVVAYFVMMIFLILKALYQMIVII